MICGKFYDFCEILRDNCAQKTRKRQLKAQKSAYKRGMWQPPEVNILMLHAAGFPESGRVFAFGNEIAKTIPLC